LLVLVDRHKNPIYESLTERVERLLELWGEKTTLRKQVEREVRKFVRGYKRYGIELDELNELYGRLIEHVKNYGS